MEEKVETQLDKLIALAGLDARISLLKKQLDAIPKAIEAQKSSYLAAEEALKETADRLKEMQKEHRSAEGALDGHLEKIRKLNDQQSLVKTNKEYQTLLGEIQNLKSEQDKYEERILELMEQSGEIEGEIREAEKVVAGEKSAFEREEARLQAEADDLRGKLAVEEKGKEEVLASVEREFLQLYTRVKNLRGDAVAEVRDELCLGCRVSVPPQKYADVIVNESIQTCANCNRILFFRKREMSGKEAG